MERTETIQKESLINVLIEEMQEETVKFKDLMMHIFFVDNMYNSIKMLLIGIIASIAGYFNIIIIGNSNSFATVLVVVGLDWITGMVLAYKNDDFDHRKAIRVVFYLAGYWAVLATVLSIEQGFDYINWLGEAVMVPILVMSLLKSVRKFVKLGIFPKELLYVIEKRVDNHMDTSSPPISDNQNLPLEPNNTQSHG